MKTHLFFAEHSLDRHVSLGEPAIRARFDSDMGIARTSARLIAGTLTGADTDLLKHEIAEAWVMQPVDPRFSVAHLRASRRFPAPEGDR